MEKYPVRLKKTGRYIKWCDDSWYETSLTPWTTFSLEEAQKVVERLERHYVFDAYIEGRETEPKPITKPKKKILAFGKSTMLKAMKLF